MHAVVDISRAVHVVPIETGNLEGGVHVQALGANVGVMSFTVRAAAGGAGVVGFRAVLPPIYGRIIRISVWPGAAAPTATPTLKITSPLGPLWTFAAIPIAGNAALTIGRDMAVYGPPLIEITDFGAANEEVVVALFVVADHEADPELDATVAAIAALTAGGMLAITGAGTGAAVRTLTSTSTGLVITDGSGSVGNPSFALDAEIQALTALVSAADKVPYYTGSGTAALADFTAAGRAILDDATAAAQATTLGLGTADSPQFAGVNIGHATDTTLARSGAGDLTVEGNALYRAGGTDVPLTDGGTGASDAATARTNLGLGTIATQAASAVAITGGTIAGVTRRVGSISIEDPVATEDISIVFTPVALTLSKMIAVLVGSATPSVTWTIRHSTDRSAVGNEVVTGGTVTTSTTTGSVVTSFNDATIPADSFIWLKTTAKSGTVDEIHITLIGDDD